MLFIKILALLASIIFAVIIIRYREQIVRIVGKNSYAERYLGQGGTYTFWVIFAISIIFLVLVWLVGIPGL